MAKPQKETLRHAQAFELYYSLGAERSLQQVANQFSVSPTATAGWASAFGWQNRIQERDRVGAQALAEKGKSEVIKMQERHLKVIRDMQGKFAQRLQADEDGECIDSKAFLAAAQYEARLLGYNPDGVNASAEDIQELLKLMLYVLQTKVADQCPTCKAALNTKEVLSNEFLNIAERFEAQAAQQSTIPS